MAHFMFDNDNGIGTVTFDLPGKFNIMNDDFISAMQDIVGALEDRRDDLSGVIVTSAKSSFFAGGDLVFLGSATPEKTDQLIAHFERLKGFFRSLEKLDVPIVAALNGTALGGGMELALSCHHRVAIDNPDTRFGLPEIDYALLPGAGGVVRLTKLLGLFPALEYLLSGKRVDPRQALRDGLIHKLSDDHNAMMHDAREWIKANPGAKQIWDVDGPIDTHNRSGDAEGSFALADLVAMHSGTHDAFAVRRITDTAVQASSMQVDAALRNETKVLVELMLRPAAKDQVAAFFSARKPKTER